jgi:elongation factor G
LRVLDGAIAVFDAVAGVEPQTETVWRQADKYAVPRICFVNKMDRIGANFARCVDMIQGRLGATVAVVQLPIGVESNFAGVIDLLEMNALVWDESSPRGEAYSVVEIPEAMQEEAARWRANLVDTVSTLDDRITEKFLNDEEITASDLRAALRRETISNQLVPVLCGAAFKNKGVQPMLDAVLAYLPSPLDVRGRRQGPVRRAGVQDHVGPAPRQAGFRPRVLGHGGPRGHGPQLDARPQGAHRADRPDARQPPRAA